MLTVHRVKSLTQAGVVYSIVQVGHAMACNCADSVYRSRTCKHVVLLRLILRANRAEPHRFSNRAELRAAVSRAEE